MCTCMDICTCMFVYVCINTCVCLPFLWNCNFFLDNWQQLEQAHKMRYTGWCILVPKNIVLWSLENCSRNANRQKQESVPSTLWVQLRMLAVQVVDDEDPENCGGVGDGHCLSIRSAESKYPQLSTRPRERRWFAGRHYQTLTLNLRSNDITTFFLPPVNL